MLLHKIVFSTLSLSTHWMGIGGEPGIKGDGRCAEGWEKRGQMVGFPMGWEVGEMGKIMHQCTILCKE